MNIAGGLSAGLSIEMAVAFFIVTASLGLTLSSVTYYIFDRISKRKEKPKNK